jgi:AraC family transcriptional regulator
MAHEPHTLGFGAALGVVADQTACGQPLNLTLHRPFEELPPHKHVNNYLCIVLRGGFAEVQGNRVRDRPCGAFFTYEAGEPHYDRYGSNGGMTVAVHFSPGEPRSGAVEGICAAFARIAAEELAFELASQSRDELAMAALTAEIMAEIQTSTTALDKGGAWMDRVVGAISDEPRRRWGLHELAGIADRHPVRLAQAFRARTGASLGAFQRLRRLTSLSLALRHSQTPLASLAAEFGYFDQSHMTSEFRRAFGVSPGRYRRDAR